MKLTVRNLQQQTFQVEVDPTDKISSVKEAVEKAKGYPVAQQKLIFSGKILDDAVTVEDCKISEKDFVVVMVAKPKAAPAPSPSTNAAEQPTTSQQKVEPAPPPAPPAASTNAPAPASASAHPAQEPPSSFSSGLVVGAEYNSAVANMVEMGFPKEQVVKAMRASYNNPDRAVEYLMTGIPENVEPLSNPPPGSSARNPGGAGATSAPPPTDRTAAAPATTSTLPASSAPVNLFEAAAQAAQRQQRVRQGGGAGGDISFLSNQPQFQQLRAMVRANPSLLEPLLQQLGQANPQLLGLINQNQEAFMRMLNEDISGEADEEGEGGLQTVEVSPEERAAIERLEGLGFERHLVLEAFLACDKNEELAANYLLNMNFEDDDQ